MNTRDYLAAAETVFTPALATMRDFALMSIAADVRRIADVMERPLEPVTAVLVETEPDGTPELDGPPEEREKPYLTDSTGVDLAAALRASLEAVKARHAQNAENAL